ncbi:MAG: hypothetical protein A3K19_26545 [Lentisphaerae bacterium RIFOXYB12_FULL_65_16]|nr:MAG: hypothetical protein A3K18_21200 [Lentisphaerae bacterium RIFOXYA12_64_32]OGV95000.1 MAG: hypothetical protein A3K19_26545 [Lentisphaerae bacterium RIFOXYB12_FULL_65_16]
MNKANPHLIVASGGTGGHFFPALAIARRFRERGGVVTFLVAGQHAEEQLQAARQGDFPAWAMEAVRLPGRGVAAVTFPFRFGRSVWAARSRLRMLAPDLVLGMGSFAAVPACLATRLLRVPLVLHEGNSYVGRANRFLSRWADVMAISLPLADERLFHCPQIRTGLPLRDDILAAAGQTTAPAEFYREVGLTPGKATLLVFGGSQGAQFLNGLMAGVSALLGDDVKRLQILHLTGTDDNAGLIDAYAKAGLVASVRRADSHIENCYLAAGLVICRSGASTISELALFGKPAILVPLPTAAEDHQTINARMLEKRAAARLLTQGQATPETVTRLLRDWLDAPAKWAELGTRIGEIASPNATDAVADLLLQTVHAKGRKGP